MTKGGVRMDALILVFACVMLGAIGQVLMKQGMNELKPVSVSDFFNISGVTRIFFTPFVFAGILIYALSTILWLTALSQLDVSLMYPLISLSYILVSVYALLFLGETISLMRWGGTALIVFGSILIVLTR
jgi:drug/metabolite transporter (DMT)-like permease